MKKTKRVLLAVLCALFLLSVTLSIVACINTANACDVSVEYDKTRGSITLSDPANADGYVLKEEVTATVRSFTHYELKSFCVNGVETELTDGAYTFTLTGDTTLAAEFVGEAVDFTVNYANTEGNVTWTAPADGIYRYGDVITLTVTPEEGMSISSVKANGITIIPENGTYSVTLATNTTVSVIFVDQAELPSTMSESTLASLQGSILFEGGYDYDDTIDAYDTHHDVTTLFDTKANAIWSCESMQGYILYEGLYVSQDGKLTLVEHTLDNTIKYTKSNDDFADFDNPFIELTVDDFNWISEGVWRLRANLARNVATAITGWNESIASFLLYEENGVINRITITTQFIGIDGDGYTSYYDFEVKEHGTAKVPADWLTPYEETAEHAELAAALAAAATAESYTVDYHSVEEGWDDLDYNIYVTLDTIYENCEGWENGYREMGGLVYPFDYYPTTGVGAYFDPLAVNSLADLRATFSGFSPALFEYLGNGVFQLRNHDYLLASDIAWAFADGADKQQLYATATTFTITIENGVLKQVEFYYDYYGYIAETVTLTYSKFNETTIDIDFSDFEMTSVFDSFVGTYSDDAGHTVVIENGRIIINGSQMDIEGFDTENFVFYGTWNDATVYVWKLSARQIMVYDEDETFVWTLKLEGYFDPVVIPAEMRGVWEDTEEDTELIIQTYAVILNGTPLEVLSYSDNEGLVCVLGNVTYNFSLIEDGMVGIVYEDGIGMIAYIFDYVGAYDEIEIPSEWVGEYEGSSNGVTYHISITVAQIVVTMGAEQYTAVITDYSRYEGFTVTLDGEEYYITNADYGYKSGPVQKIALMSEDLRTINVVLERISSGGTDPDPEPTGNIPDKFCGTFKNTINGDEWIITITKSSVAVSIGGAAQSVYGVEYDDIYEEIYFYMGEWYVISAASQNDPVTTIWLMKEKDYSFMKTLSRVSGGTTTPEPNEPETPDGQIPTKYIGEYEGDSDGTHYYVVITATSITVTIGNGAPIVAVISDYDDYEGFTFTLNDVEYYLFQLNPEDTVDSVFFMDADGSFVVLLTRVSGSTTEH